MEDEDDGGDAIIDDDKPNVADVAHDDVENVSRDSDDAIAGGVQGTDNSDDQQFLNTDVLEIIIKLTSCTFPFMRDNLKSVNIFFKSTGDKVPFPRVYIPELPDHATVISVRKIVMLKGRGSGAVVRLQQIIRSPKWHHAWLKLATTVGMVLDNEHTLEACTDSGKLALLL